MSWEEPTNPPCCGDWWVPDEPCKTKCERGHCHTNRKLWVPLWTACPQSRRKDTWLCVFIDIFPFKKSIVFLANIFLILTLRRYIFFWIILYEHQPSGVSAPHLKNLQWKKYTLGRLSFPLQWDPISKLISSLCADLYAQHPWAKALSLFISYFTDFFFFYRDLVLPQVRKKVGISSTNNVTENHFIHTETSMWERDTATLGLTEELPDTEIWWADRMG